MTTHTARRLQQNWNATKGNTVCLHQRMVDTLESKGRADSQLLVCCECGAMILDPGAKLGKNTITKKAGETFAFAS